MRSSCLAIALFAGLLMFSSALAAPPEPGTCPPFDHSHARWARLLGEYVQAGEVDYLRWKAEGVEELQRYLRELERVCHADFEKLEPNQRLAFWINAYNAYTVSFVLDRYPLESIRSIGVLPGGAFRKSFIPLQHLTGARAQLSLNDVEHGVIRKGFKEPRIHFALVCASRSCPKLQEEAWVAHKLDEQLEAAARQFLSDPRENRYDPRTQTLHLSSIFKWYGEDFEQDGTSLAAHVSKWLPAPAREAVLASEPRVSFLDYDWSLNERKAR